MPGIVPLGNQAASSLLYTPALGSAGMRSCGPSYQVLQAAIAAGARPHTCPTVAICVEKFLQLSARLAGCGGSPPKVTAEKKVMSVVLCTSLIHTLSVGSVHHAPQQEVGRCWTCCLCCCWPAPGTQTVPQGTTTSATRTVGFIFNHLPCRIRSLLLSPV